MNINRHNYEEFFILYMDNELSGTDRRMVEAFVQNNPDLKDELDLLLQSRLVPENNIVFENKEELMRMTNNSSVNLADCEEWFTLYIDNELTLEQKAEVEKFIALYPQTKEAFSLLQKAKLQPEEIVFPYKESLYRRTEKVRIVQMRWFRIAAAAVLFIAFSLTAFFILNNKNPQSGGPVVKTNPGTLDQPSFEKKSNDADVKNLASTPGNNTITPNEQSPQEKKKDVLKINKNDNPVVKEELPVNIPAENENRAIAQNTNTAQTNNLPDATSNPNVTNNSANPDIAYTKIPNKKLNPAQTYDELVTNGITETSGFKFASQTVDDNLIADDEGSNKKSRGLFRKVVRFLEKRTGINAANDDNKVLIGAVAVKLN